jgi:nicotinamidase-related amidase
MNPETCIISRADAALVVIDIQEKLAAAMDPAVIAQTVKNTGILIEAAKLFGMPVIVSEQYRRGLGPTLAPLAEKLAGVEPLEKLFFDCVRDEGLAKAIAGCGRRTFIVTGIETHVCVFQTALSLLRKGYRAVVAADAVASRRKLDWEYALRALAGAGSLVYPTETIAFMLLEKAGTDEFKELAPLFK